MKVEKMFAFTMIFVLLALSSCSNSTESGNNVIIKSSLEDTPIQNSMNVYCENMIDESEGVKEITDLAQLYEADGQYIYFGRPTCDMCVRCEPYLLSAIQSSKVSVLYFNTDNWREHENFEVILERYEVKSVPIIIYVEKGQVVDSLFMNQVENMNIYEGIQQFINGIEISKKEYMIDNSKYIQYMVLVYMIINFLNGLIKLKYDSIMCELLSIVCDIIVFLISLVSIWHTAIYIDNNGLYGYTIITISTLLSGVLCFIGGSFRIKKYCKRRR